MGGGMRVEECWPNPLRKETKKTRTTLDPHPPLPPVKRPRTPSARVSTRP